MPANPPPAQLLPVVQADRIAAASYVRSMASPGMRLLGAGSGILAGELDDHPATQAFAAHRIAHAPEPALFEALEKIAAFKPAHESGDWADKLDRIGYNRAGNYAAEIARQAITAWNTRAPSPERGEFASLVEALPEEPSDAVIRAVDKALHQHWPNARKMAVAMYGVIREAALHALSASPEGEGK